jgi:antirestriction protein ArdC
MNRDPQAICEAAAAAQKAAEWLLQKAGLALPA